MSIKEESLSIVITDRLNETRKIEAKLKIDETNSTDKKAYNKELIERLKQFQHDANDLMTEFVVKEKEALASKKICNDHLKIDKNNKQAKVEISDESGESSSEEIDGNMSENEANNKTTKRPSDENCQQEPAEKKNCLENSVCN